jgi:hypothetical protein
VAHAEKAGVRMGDEGRPVVLVGPPRAVRGEFRVSNLAERKVVVRQPLLRTAAPVSRKHREAAAGPADQYTLRRIVLRPGQTRAVPVALSLDPRTPPGSYEGWLEVEGERRDAVVHVTEEVALAIAPATVVVPARPGARVEKRVVLTNEGNVPVPVRSIGAVVLDEELAHCRALRGALEDVGDTMEKLDDFVVALGRRYRRIYETLVLRVRNEELTLAPGETRPLELKITLPEKLEPRSRYLGYTAIATSNLGFTVVGD